MLYNIKVSKSHTCSAMDGYNSVIFAYGPTALKKTFTLVCSFLSSSLDLVIYLLNQSGDQEELDIVPQAMKHQQTLILAIDAVKIHRQP